MSLEGFSGGGPNHIHIRPIRNDHFSVVHNEGSNSRDISGSPVQKVPVASTFQRPDFEIKNFMPKGFGRFRLTDDSFWKDSVRQFISEKKSDPRSVRPEIEETISWYAGRENFPMLVDFMFFIFDSVHALPPGTVLVESVEDSTLWSLSCSLLGMDNGLHLYGSFRNMQGWSSFDQNHTSTDMAVVFKKLIELTDSPEGCNDRNLAWELFTSLVQAFTDRGDMSRASYLLLCFEQLGVEWNVTEYQLLRSNLRGAPPEGGVLDFSPISLN
jgi:hypothetical protein